LSVARDDARLAVPQAVQSFAAAAQAFGRVGIPEGNFPLAQAALCLATA